MPSLLEALQRGVVAVFPQAVPAKLLCVCHITWTASAEDRFLLECRPGEFEQILRHRHSQQLRLPAGAKLRKTDAVDAGESRSTVYSEKRRHPLPGNQPSAERSRGQIRAGRSFTVKASSQNFRKVRKKSEHLHRPRPFMDREIPAVSFHGRGHPFEKAGSQGKSQTGYAEGAGQNVRELVGK